MAGAAFHFPTNTYGTFAAASAGKPFYDFSNGFTFSFWAAIPDRISKGERAWSGNADKDWQDFSKHELKNYPSSVGWVQVVARYDAAAEGTVDLYPYFNGNRIVPPGANNNYLSEGKRATNNTSKAFSTVCRAAKPDEGWHHYAFTHDGMYLAAYLDGTLLRRQFWPFVLNVAGRPLSQREMGERLLVDRMEKAGLVERRAVAGDRRRHAVSLTAAGRAELARSEPDYAALVNRAMSAFTRSEVATLTRLMVKLHDSIDSLPSTPPVSRPTSQASRTESARPSRSNP